jgi:hypothetical protein
LPRDESGGFLYSWPGGVRRRGGASSVSGSGVELGNRSLRWGWSWVDMIGVRENSEQLNL